MRQLFKVNLLVWSLTGLLSACGKDALPPEPPTLPPAFETQLQHLQAQLPLKVPNVMTLSEVKVQDAGIHYTYQMHSPKMEVAALNPSHVSKITAISFCSDAVVKEALEQGFRIHGHYMFASEPAIEVAFDHSDCPS